MGQIYDIFKIAAQKSPDKTALITESLSYSYDHILAKADAWANYLISQKSGQARVGLLTEDPFHTITASLAIAKINAACIPTNPQMLPAQLTQGWLATDVNIVIYEPCFESKIKACSNNDITFLASDTIPEHVSNLELLIEEDQKDFIITLSSGSTGAPKPIVISQDVKAKRAKQAWDMYDLTENDVVLCASPYFHSMGQRLVYVALLLGATLVHMTRFTPKAWLKLVERHQVSYVTAVSSHLYALKDSLLNNVAQIKSLKTIVTSSAPIDTEFKNALFNAIGCDFHEIYGATEVACASNLFPKDAQEKYATVGTLCDDVDIRILDDTGNEVNLDQIGEIAVKTPLAFEGYYKRDDLNQNAIHDGYFLTGDLGSIDCDGFLSYVARKKDVIISGGINIYPADIENTLSQHPLLKEIAVIGVLDDLLGEVIVAVCVSKDQVNIETELRKISNKQLASFQRPLKFFFVEKLPLTPSGKLSKNLLREEYNKKNDGWTLTLRMMLYGE